jgi:hypothetical protein
VTKGAGELEALPAEVLSVFSRRRQEIVEAAREAGIEDLASERGKYLAVLTRERKQYGIETHTWREEVRARRRCTASMAGRSSSSSTLASVV